MTMKRLIGYGATVLVAAILVVSWSVIGAEADRPEYPIDRAQVLKELGNEHPQVRSALADGTVTAEEVRTSLADTVSCMDAAGITVEEAAFSDDGHITMRYDSGSIDDAAQRADQIQADCLAEHAEPVARAYGIERMPTLLQLDLYHNAVVSCVNERGFAVESPEELDTVVDRSAVRQCSREAEASTLGR